MVRDKNLKIFPLNLLRGLNKHCIEMHKSGISNCKKLENFNVRDLDKTRRRKKLIIEPV